MPNYLATNRLLSIFTAATHWRLITGAFSCFIKFGILSGIHFFVVGLLRLIFAHPIFVAGEKFSIGYDR